MTTVISFLRGINVGGHNQIKMDELRAVYESLGLKNPQTYVQSGNIVFRTEDRNLVRLTETMEAAIERKFGFHVAVVLRTCSELKQVVAGNPFAKRNEIEPGKLAIVFCSQEPTPQACEELLRMKAGAEEVHICDREFYIYFADGMGRSKLFATLGRKLKSGTARNWNTVTKLLEIANALDAGGC
jgi:uncharacterized protein (DUF1697 family)